MRKYTCAVIVAAGNSTRMGFSLPKQLIKINGKPVIEHTLTVFEKSDVIDEIVVVCREADKKEISEIASKFPKVKAITIGGETRLHSVRNGILEASDSTQLYAIHDGARMLITAEDIKKVVDKASAFSAATLATAVTDTVKVVDSEDIILSTPNRSALRAVQTPQVFEKHLYQKALKNAIDNNLSVTDDCSMVESIGEKVYTVIGSCENIKLTTKTDIIFAEAILNSRNNSLLEL